MSTTSKCIKRVRGDLEPDLPFQVMLNEAGRCPSLRARDLTEITVRAMLYNSYLIEDDLCTGRSYVNPENALWHRVLPKREIDLLAATAVAAPAVDELIDRDQDPASAQRISIEITGFAAAGTITLTGTDIDGEVLTEAVPVAADGILFTTAAFATLDSLDTEADPNTSGVVVSALSAFTFRLYVHDGLVDLVWQAGDTDLSGDYLLRLELVHSNGELETACDILCLKIAEKIKRPIPIIESVAADPASVGVALTVQGLHFLDLQGTRLVEVDTGTETALAVDETLNPLTVDTFDTDPIPVIPGGNYQIIPIGAEDEGLPFAFIILPIVTNFSPTTVNPGDTVTIDGDGFTGATAIDLIDSNGVATPMDNFTFVNDDQVTGDVPLALALGDYTLRVTGALNPSNTLGTLTVE